MDRFDGLNPEVDEETNQEEIEQEEVETEELEDEQAEVVDDEDGEYEEEDDVPQAYTAEELKAVISGEAKLDTSRLSPEGLAIMKEMSRGLTPKLQEAAEARKELERLRQEMEAAKPKAQPKDIYEAYDQDPEGVVQYVNNQIKELVASDDPNARIQIEQLRDLKEEFRTRETSRYRESQQKAQQAQEVMREIVKAVPDIGTKQAELAKFAIEEMGYTQEELAYATDPAVAGKAAVTTIERINRMYDKMNATKTLPTKKKKRQATRTEKPGRGFEEPETDLKELKQKAREDGNWMDVFMALEGDD